MLTATARAKVAEAKDRERERLVRLGVGAGGQFGLRLRAEAIKAYKRLGSPEAVAGTIKAATSLLVPAVARSMTAAYLTGYRRAQLTAAKSGAKLALSLAADPFREALTFLQNRMDAPDVLLSKLTRAFGPEATTVTGQFAGAVERRLSEAVYQSVAGGEHVAQGIARIREAFDAAGITNQSPFAVETLFRTQTAVAYSAGQWAANSDPAIQEVLWGYEYMTVGDDRVRPNHAALDGVKMEKNDPRWAQLMPPCGYNCRCTVVEIFHDDPGAKSTGLHPRTIDGETVAPSADAGWDFNPGEVYAQLTA